MQSNRRQYILGRIITALLGTAVLSVLVILGLIWAFFMYTVTVEPGHEVVLTDKPYFFGHEGLRSEPLKEGRKLLFKTTTAQVVRMTPQVVPVPFDDLTTSDRFLLDFDAVIRYRFTDSVGLVRDFGADRWYVNNIDHQFRAIVREAVKKRALPDMMASVTTAQEVDDEVTRELKQFVADTKLQINILGVSLGRAKPNSEVLSQMNKTAAERQRKLTLIEAEQAEIQREREQTARARADNAYRNSIGLSPEQFVQLEGIKRYSEACAKSTCIIGQVPVVVGR